MEIRERRIKGGGGGGEIRGKEDVEEKKIY